MSQSSVIPVQTVTDDDVFSLRSTLQATVNNSPTTETIVEWAECHHSDLQRILNVVNCPSRATFSDLLQVDVSVKKKLFAAFTSAYIPVSTKGGVTVCITRFLLHFLGQSSLCGT